MTPSKSEILIRDLFATAEVEVNGKKPWDVRVHDARLFDRVLRESSLGLGEAYMDGWWDCDAIDELFSRLLKARLAAKVKGNWKIARHILRSRLFNLQAPSKAFEVGEQHFDLGNELYRAMLDKRLNYTCGYWKDATNLDDAQEAKLELICKKIGLRPGMSVLDLGCGWGSFAKYAAEVHGARILGVTVSKEQVALGRERCKGLPVELRLQDYREVQGKYDAVISIGIIEHVGYKNYRSYMKVTDRCLKEGGIAFLQTIGSNESSSHGNPWLTKYIFPNGMLPSIEQLGRAMSGLFVMEDWHNLGPHYDKTLQVWYANFEKAWPDLQARYGERFHRMWRYYLLTCAGAFRARHMVLWQVVMTRLGSTQPDCRFS